MRTIWIKYYLSILILILYSGCALFKPQEEPIIPSNLPSTYTMYNMMIQANKECTNIYWWTSFNNPELNKLIHNALNDNFDINIAWSRLAQSEATIKIYRSPFFPFIDTSATLSHQRTNSQKITSENKDELIKNTNLNIGLGASYEIDLWGRITAGYKVNRLKHQANLYDLYTSMMTTTANITDIWIAIIGTKEELAVLEKQINTNKLLLKNQLLRFNNAMSSGLDVLQQQEVLVASEAEKPLLEMQLCTLHTQLALLSGVYPSSFNQITTATLPNIPPIPYIGIPSDLIIQRPDIQSAWYKLNAAKWNTSAAKADCLPSIRLSAVVSSTTDMKENIFSNWITNLSSALTAPIFHGGKLTAEVERNVALVNEQIQIYGKTVAQALGEVENALANEYHQTQRIHHLLKQLDYANVAWTESLNSYLGGRDSFLRYITMLKNVQSLERRVIQEKTTLLRYRVALYRTLGGSWTNSIIGKLK